LTHCGSIGFRRSAFGFREKPEDLGTERTSQGRNPKAGYPASAFGEGPRARTERFSESRTPKAERRLPGAAVIEHVLSIPRPQTHSIRVELRVDVDPSRTQQEVCFPVWTPGSYLVREHERHIHDLRASGGDGRPLPVRKTDKNTYRIDTAGASRLRVEWEAYAHELTVRTSHVDDTHAFVNPVTCCAWLPGRESETQRLVVRELPPGWGVASPLAPPADAGAPDGTAHVRTARDFDELIDSPLECGPHARPENRIPFAVRGVPHELVVWGRSAYDFAGVTDELARIVEAQAALFGGLPYGRYVFFVLLGDQGRGGLEHRDCAALLMPRTFHEKPRGAEDLLGLVSHELFHAWNVKRIRPAAFTPYDLSRENRTRLLWAFEGLTSYYGDLMLRRAGLVSRARWLEKLGEALTSLERVEGRRRLSLSDASFDAWIRHYRQDENTDNSAVSYYLKGEVVGVLADLHIRRLSGGRTSLDDAMRLLWERHGRTGAGVPEDGVEAICAEVAGAPMQGLFDAALRGTGELPMEEALASHGLRLERRVSQGPDDKGGPPPSPKDSTRRGALRCHLGLALKAEDGRVRVTSVQRGSPSEDAGLCPGDELAAIDGIRAESSTAFARAHDRAPGTTATLTVFRRDELRSVAIVAGPPRTDAAVVAVDPSASPEALRRLEAWLGPD